MTWLAPLLILLLTRIAGGAAPGQEAGEPAVAAEAAEHEPRLEAAITEALPARGPARWACTAERIFEGRKSEPYDHFGHDLAAWRAPDGDLHLLVGGGNRYETLRDPPSDKLERAGLFVLDADLEQGPRVDDEPDLRLVGEQLGDRFAHAATFLRARNGERPHLICGAPRAPRREDGTYGESGKLYLFLAEQLAAAEPGAELAAGGASLVLSGRAPGDRFGWSVADGGDLDGDGAADLLVGAPGSVGVLANPGRAFVLSGARLVALARDPQAPRELAVDDPRLRALVLEGAEASDRFGYCVAGVGDVNGDGRDDAAFGAPQFHWSLARETWIYPLPPRTSRGYVRVLLGAEELRADGPALLVHGFTDDGQFGRSVAGGHDADGDGHPDLIVGAPFASLPSRAGEGAIEESGELLVVSPLHPERPLLRFVHPQAGARLGMEVCALGDVDGDGRDDLAVGAPFANVAPVESVEGCGAGLQGGIRAGRLFVLRGGTGLDGRPPEVLLDVFGEGERDQLGISIARVGDLDGNGREELLFGAQAYPFDPGTECGRAYLLIL